MAGAGMATANVAAGTITLRPKSRSTCTIESRPTSVRVVVRSTVPGSWGNTQT